MSEKEELQRLLKDVPQIQKMLLAALTDAAEKEIDKEGLFSSAPFQELLASNLFYILTSRLDINEDSRKDADNASFISKYIWAMIKTIPVPLLISVVLANIEFNHKLELSDFHRVFGRGCNPGQKHNGGIIFEVVPGRTPS